MLGIQAIGTYVPEGRVDNLALAERFGFAENFLHSKIGVLSTSRKSPVEETSDLCVAAVKALAAKCLGDLDLTTVQCIVVVTQNPDAGGLPHTSAIVHGKLGLPEQCFAFDISLGCSGFVAGLAIVTGFMQVAGLHKGLLITADPYSKIVDAGDRNTALLFGDGAAATLISNEPVWEIGAFDCGTVGQSSGSLKIEENGSLYMNGRAVFDFSATQVPKSVEKVLEENNLQLSDISLAIMHQGSKYIVDTIAKRLKLKEVMWGCQTYGNTVSSSIPILLADVSPVANPVVLVSGFGVGLGWATTILRSRR